MASHRPRLLLVYYRSTASVRATVDEHLSSFGSSADAEVHYLNVAFGVPWWVKRLEFDAILFHYTFLATKWDPSHFRRMRDRCAALARMPALKAVLPQDEYVHSEAVCSFIRDFGVEVLLSVAPPADRSLIYADVLSQLRVQETVLTGYVDGRTRQRVEALARPLSERPIDIGYRGRRVPFWLGRRAQVKWRMAEPVRQAAEARGLRADVSCDPRSAFPGDAWYRFLARCRVVLGCEGGAGLLDRDGRIRRAVEAYLREHPEAGFEEVAAACFPTEDDSLDLFVLSPRQLDACVTRTCQVLVEGTYSGVLEPGRHYIPLRRDLSNLDEVLDQVLDVPHCERIAERARADIVDSGLYGYDRFAKSCLDSLRPLLRTPRTRPPSLIVRSAAAIHDPLTRAALRIRDAVLGVFGRQGVES